MINASSFLFLALTLDPGVSMRSAPSDAPTTQTSPAVKSVRLAVDHTPLLERQIPFAAEKSGRFVLEDATKALREEYGVDVVNRDAAPAILVELAWKDYENSVYLIEISIQRPGEKPAIVASFEATCLNSSALTAAVVGELPGVLDRLDDPEPEDPPIMTEPEPIKEPTRTTDQRSQVNERGRRPLRMLGQAGIGVAAVGVAALVTGGVLYSRGRRYDDAPGSFERAEGADFRPPGVALMATGGVALLTGAALLIVDRTRPRRGVTARIFPSRAGLVVVGRF